MKNRYLLYCRRLMTEKEKKGNKNNNLNNRIPINGEKVLKTKN